jgi:tetratricopeptide (TPR) repeat protein
VSGELQVQSPARGPSAGQELPGAHVLTMENHDEAYYVWKEHGVRDRVLVHVDAHHDMYGEWQDPDKKRTTIANYILRALDEGLVREAIWVVPDATWTSARGRRSAFRAARKIVRKTRKSPRAAGRVTWDAHGRVSSRVLGRPLTICPRALIPQIEEDVLLDIDVDFMIIPDIGYRGITAYGELPWCWPAELLSSLHERGVRPDLCTIAYSVEGGYTPLQWKYLGDELALRLRGTDQDAAALEATERLRAAALAAQGHDLAAAEEGYRAAQRLWPASAAPWYHLAHLQCALGQSQEAQSSARQALALDPSYRTAYSSSGLWYFWEGRLADAERAYQRALDLNPDDPYAHLGLGLLAVRRKRWSEAESILTTALGLNPDLVDAHRALGRVLTRLGRVPEAIHALERSLRLTLAGCPALVDGLIMTHAPVEHLADNEHARVHTDLASLYARQGALDTAIQGYRMGIALGDRRARVRLRLAGLYLRRRHWRRAVREAGLLAARLPHATWGSVRQGYRSTRRYIARGWATARSWRRPERTISMWS